MTEKNDSKWTSLATAPILGQAPRELAAASFPSVLLVHDLENRLGGVLVDADLHVAVGACGQWIITTTATTDHFTEKYPYPDVMV